MAPHGQMFIKHVSSRWKQAKSSQNFGHVLRKTHDRPIQSALNSLTVPPPERLHSTWWRLNNDIHHPFSDALAKISTACSDVMEFYRELLAAVSARHCPTRYEQCPEKTRTPDEHFFELRPTALRL